MKILQSSYQIPTHPTWEVIDGTKLSCYVTCERKFFYEYILGWESEAPNNHLVFGEAWHLAMAHLLKNGYSLREVDTAIGMFEDRYREDFPPETDELFHPKTPARAIEALVIYAKQYSSDHREFDVLHVEVGGSVPIDSRRVIYFKMDSILRGRGDHYFSLEHKTRGGNLDTAWAMNWRLSFQVGIYTHVLYCLFPRASIKGVIINGCAFRKVKESSKAKKVEFQRYPCWKSPNQMMSWHENILTHMDALERDYQILSDASPSDKVLQAFPLRVESCTKYWGCKWHPYCTAWSNPLQHCDKPPMGYKIRFWDPREKEVEHKVEKGEFLT